MSTSIKVLFICSIGLNFYLYNKIKIIQNSNSILFNTTNSSSNSFSTKKLKNKKISDQVLITSSAVDKGTENKKLLNEQLEKRDNNSASQFVFTPDEVMENFELASQEFIETNLRLPGNVYDEYKQIKESFYKKESEFFEQNEQFYKPSPGTRLAIPPVHITMEKNKILSNHLEMLRRLFGEEEHNKYMKFVYRFNQEIVRNTKEGEPFIIIDF